MDNKRNNSHRFKIKKSVDFCDSKSMSAREIWMVLKIEQISSMNRNIFRSIPTLWIFQLHTTVRRFTIFLYFYSKAHFSRIIIFSRYTLSEWIYPWLYTSQLSITIITDYFMDIMLAIRIATYLQAARLLVTLPSLFLSGSYSIIIKPNGNAITANQFVYVCVFMIFG